jgi:hypothetical protein
VDTVQVVQEVLQIVGPVLPDDEGVVHVAKPAGGLWVAKSRAFSKFSI